MGKIPEELREIIAHNILLCRRQNFPGRGGQKKCAEAFNVSPQQWSPWEKGVRTPDELRLEQIARFFGKTVEWMRRDHRPGSQESNRIDLPYSINVPQDKSDVAEFKLSACTPPGQNPLWVKDSELPKFIENDIWNLMKYMSSNLSTHLNLGYEFEVFVTKQNIPSFIIPPPSPIPPVSNGQKNIIDSNSDFSVAESTARLEKIVVSMSKDVDALKKLNKRKNRNKPPAHPPPHRRRAKKTR